MRLLRWRIRTLMIALVLLGLTLGGVQAIRVEQRFQWYRQKAADYADAEQQSRSSASEQMERALECRDKALSVARSVSVDASMLEVIRRFHLGGPLDPMPGSGFDEPAASDPSERLATTVARGTERGWSLAQQAVDLRARAETDRRKADYYARMKSKYQSAANHPGLLVAPDPPEPQ